MELSEQDKTIFSMCISVINAARSDEHLGHPILLQKSLNELKKFFSEEFEKYGGVNE